AAGFSALRHRLHWHALLATPLLMCAMILIAATFTLRQDRRGSTIFVIAAGVLTGFTLYVAQDFVFALGLSDSIPVTLAAWTPSGAGRVLGIGTVVLLGAGLCGARRGLPEGGDVSARRWGFRALAPVWPRARRPPSRGCPKRRSCCRPTRCATTASSTSSPP